MNVWALTDIGKKRNENQDSFAIGQTPGGITWAVVCDGMGGAAGGAIASKIAAESAKQLIDKQLTDDCSHEKAAVILRAAAILGNSRILRSAFENPAQSGMGTTYVAAVVIDNKAVTVHSGDSRCYIITAAGEIFQITKDHSYVQSLVDKGEITPEEAENHIYKNIITRALGAASDIETDLNIYDVNPGDILLLCSDGLSNMVSSDDLIYLIRNGDIESAPRRLIDAANNNGGNDNITAAVIRV